nr:Protein of unknown function DUF148 domain containing protein [Haemonchus contortus]
MFHPPFINDASWDAQHEYYQILFNKTLTITEQKKEVRAWAEENDLTKEVESFFSQIGEGVVDMNKNVSKLIHALPVAFRNLTKILRNEHQTLSQMQNSMDKLKAEHPAVFSVLDTAMKEVMGENDGPHGSQAKPQELRFPLPSIPRRQLSPRNVSLEARLDYHKIFVNKTLTIAEQKEEIRAWAKENNLTSEVTTFFSEIDKGVVEMKQKVAKLVDASPEAVENFTKIMENENQTMSQMMKAIEKLRLEHPSVFNVYDSAMKEVMGNNPCTELDGKWDSKTPGVSGVSNECCKATFSMLRATTERRFAGFDMLTISCRTFCNAHRPSMKINLYKFI